MNAREKNEQVYTALQEGIALVESAFAHVSHGGPTRADAEKWLNQAKHALEEPAPAPTTSAEPPTWKQLQNFFHRHSPVLWDDSWRCSCSRWALGRKINSAQQADKSRAEHLADEFLEEFRAALRQPGTPAEEKP